MRKILSATIGVIILLSGCGSFGGGNGELVGVHGRKPWVEAEPYGMVLIPRGSYQMGPSDEDPAWGMNSQVKTVSIESFWMDETEITNNEYRQFVYWVRDSIARRLLGEQIDEFVIMEDRNGNPIDPPLLNWDERIIWNDEEHSAILEELHYPQNERFFNRKELDVRKLEYSYEWVDYLQAAKKTNRFDPVTGEYSGSAVDQYGESAPINDRSAFIMKDKVFVYPDTLCWISDFTYSYNEPYTNLYFWHPGFDNYPVVGVNWKQATAFCHWRTNYHNSYLSQRGEPFVQNYRLPTEAEWEYAARGGLTMSMYPWGGMYTRNNKGCFLANFKPLRGNYVDDGGMYSIEVGTYPPNDYGLYDMSGNIAEWTSSAFDESAYSVTHDLNPTFKYNALPDDAPVRKRKVVRGGSWKDIAYFLQTGTRSYEYQDSAKSYVGFRCVRSTIGMVN